MDLSFDDHLLPQPDWATTAAHFPLPPITDDENDILIPVYFPTVPDSLNMASRVTLPKFSGFTMENASRFLTAFNSYATLYQLTNDDRKVAAFHLHLAGPALKQ